MKPKRRRVVLFNVLPLIGIGLTIWEMNIYRRTFIPFGIPFLIYVLSGLFLLPLLRKPMALYFNTLPFFQYLYNTITFGGMIVFAFMWTNEHFPSPEKTTSTEQIISTGSLYGKSCRPPTVKIAYHDLVKDLVYPCGTDVAHYDSVDVTTSKGLWGFDILVDSKLN